MIKSEAEARESLRALKILSMKQLQRCCSSTKRKVRVEPMEIYKYLPQTNCGKCGEQSCYTFAIKLMVGEIALDKCTPLKNRAM